MSKRDIEPFEYLPVCMKLVAKPGALLSVIDHGGGANVMTIGWCHVGVLWSRPICIVYVRPSRHSYTCLEQIRQFVVNIAPVELAEAVMLCGTRSGRDVDKFAAAELTAVPAKEVAPPAITECILHYECNVVHHNDMQPENMQRKIIEASYAGGDFHRCYFGEIAACYGDREALKKAGGA